MSRKDFDMERFCRLNSKKPTARERWVAFHRLFRLASGHGAHHDIAAGECFRVLFGSWRAIQMLEDSPADPIPLHKVPKCLRSLIIKGRIRDRLYGDHPEWRERDQEVVAKLRDQGVEATPEEVNTVRRKVLRIAREKAIEHGIDLPADDNEVLRIIKGVN